MAESHRDRLHGVLEAIDRPAIAIQPLEDLRAGARFLGEVGQHAPVEVRASAPALGGTTRQARASASPADSASPDSAGPSAAAATGPPAPRPSAWPSTGPAHPPAAAGKAGGQAREGEIV